MDTEYEKPRQRRMRRRVAVIAAMLMSIAGVAGASVLVQNFMSAEFNAGAPPCLIKTAGVDTSFDGFDFDLLTTPDATSGLNLTREHITIDGLTGDKVLATEVYVIENNCAVDLEVQIVDGVQAGNWEHKYLEVYLGTVIAPVGYPGVAGSTGWDTPIIFEDGVTGVQTSSVITVLAGDEVPVGLVVVTDDAADPADASGTATWTVQAETP